MDLVAKRNLEPNTPFSYSNWGKRSWIMDSWAAAAQAMVTRRSWTGWAHSSRRLFICGIFGVYTAALVVLHITAAVLHRWAIFYGAHTETLTTIGETSSSAVMEATSIVSLTLQAGSAVEASQLLPKSRQLRKFEVLLANSYHSEILQVNVLNLGNKRQVKLGLKTFLKVETLAVDMDCHHRLEWPCKRPQTLYYK
ncbi:hypothetical protein SELMODRAFT_412359 [Selaginella moellendorffii]|uniref:Uncharacterized protein n=1 Tax=Selaginella moellendorffii TaxID=88036 RepID=D8RKW7_SELML|nr:hypothetical protein SELMODRAFT_412359 [Selaginella moellendorffii]